MANPEHIAIRKQGVEFWNEWREKNIDVTPDLSGANLDGANLSGANLSGADLFRADLIKANLSEADLCGAALRKADLSQADLRRAKLRRANLRWADLRRADLSEADLRRADLSWADLRRADLRADLSEADLFRADLRGADLRRANLRRADLSRADLSEADLRGAWLERASFVETNLKDANLSECHIYGISAWNLQLDGTQQDNLVITQGTEPKITVDNLEVAQFVYLLLNNRKIRDIINTITTKAVLILGNFSPERKIILDALRDKLREYNYVPILFDFDKPTTRDLTETVSTLAHMARFIIADLTLPRSVPHELREIVPSLTVPVQPIFQPNLEAEAKNVYAMFQDLRRKYHWVLPVLEYQGIEGLLPILSEKIISPAEAKAKELEQK